MRLTGRLSDEINAGNGTAFLLGSIYIKPSFERNQCYSPIHPTYV
jgi:hypothetical protein